MLKVGREIVCYDQAAGHLATARGPFHDKVFGVCHANLRCALFTAQHGCLTFTPQRGVVARGGEVRSWETLSQRPGLRSTHSYDISDYFADAPSEPATLSHFSLALLREPEFPAIIEHAIRLGRQLADRPDLRLAAP